MNKIIQLTRKPWKTAIAFEITGIQVRALAQDPDGPVSVNGEDVFESYNEVIYLLMKVCKD